MYLKAFAMSLVAMMLLASMPSMAANEAEINSDSRAALETLKKNNIMAKALAEKAKGILVFPKILKAGFIIGGEGGNGALFKHGKAVGYYNIAAGSFGLQAGVEEFGYAMFFMNDAALQYLNKSKGWEVGVGPTLVIVNKETVAAFGKNVTTSTLKDDIYAFVFSQEGLMGGLGLQGSKITRIHPK
jgi:lipid-binding SYLF domain-containing protein